MLQICANIKQAREKAGFSQEEMAVLLGLSRTTYANWEAETEPKIATLKRIAQILGVEFSQLINEKVGEDKLSPTAERLLKLLEKQTETVNSQQHVIRRYIENEPDIGEVPKNASPSPQMKTIKPQK